MTVTRTVAGNSESTVYMLDGTPSKDVLGKGGVEIEQTYTSTWEGNVLVTTIATPARHASSGARSSPTAR